MSTQRAVEAVWRIEGPKVVARMTRMVRDVGLAEDVAQDAFVRALETWPQSGVPDNPGAWLMTTARNRALDVLRRDRSYAEKEVELRRELDPVSPPADAELDDVGDDVLRLMFLTCHPVLSTDARVTLTLRLLGGLTTREVARALLVPDATAGQRISRAKKTLSDARVPFELPGRDELEQRLGAVLEVVYLVFNEGYAATEGERWVRPELCSDALRLGRVLAALMPREPEVHGLVALMEIQASRLPARLDADGAPVLLDDQDRFRWDRLLIRRGLVALDRVAALRKPYGPYALQAAIAACHARARTPEDTDWPRIAAIYAALARVTGSPVVELNRAVAISRADGPEAGLAHVDALAATGALPDYHLLHSVRGDLLARLGRTAEARDELLAAVRGTTNRAERAMLEARLRATVR